MHSSTFWVFWLFDPSKSANLKIIYSPISDLEDEKFTCALCGPYFNVLLRPHMALQSHIFCPNWCWLMQNVVYGVPTGKNWEIEWEFTTKHHTNTSSSALSYSHVGRSSFGDPVSLQQSCWLVNQSNPVLLEGKKLYLMILYQYNDFTALYILLCSPSVLY